MISESEEEGGSSIENQKIAKMSRRKTYASGSSKQLPDTEVDREEGGSFTGKRKKKTSSRRKTCATEFSKEAPDTGVDSGLLGNKSSTQVDDANPGQHKGKETASTNTHETTRQNSEQLVSEHQNPNGTPAAKDDYEDWLTPDREVREGSWISETDKSMEKKLEKVKEVEETLNRLENELKQRVREISRLVGKQEKEKMKEEVRKIKESLEKSKVDLTAVITK
jgi:flagellar motility protein MotE (MotC chaperone)